MRTCNWDLGPDLGRERSRVGALARSCLGAVSAVGVLAGWRVGAMAGAVAVVEHIRNQNQPAARLGVALDEDTW